MQNLAETKSALLKNIKTLARHGSGSPKEQKFHNQRIKNGKVFLAYCYNGDVLFAPSRFAGYKDNSIRREKTLPERDGRVTNIQITKVLGKYHDTTSPQYRQIDQAFLSYCAKFKIIPSKHHRSRRYWLIGTLTESKNKTYLLPDEFDDTWTVVEGAKTNVVVNKYERDRRARARCIQYYGAKCSVCDLEFDKRYSGLGKGFIHVHHIVPIATIGKQYKLNPVKDLRPVCPNCHAILHLGEGRVLGIKELRSIFKENGRH
jgi:5-methylcytosine-specific restriction protein A